MLKEIGAQAEPMPCSALHRIPRITAATLSHHIKELETAGLIKTVRDGKFMNITPHREILHAYLERLAMI
jgi:ArsR family transcriptional regulator